MRTLGLMVSAASALLLSGCGVEGLFNLYLGDQYTQNLNRVRGTISLTDARFFLVDAAGEEIPAFESKVEGGSYEAGFVAQGYSGVRIRAVQGQAVLEAFLPEMAFEDVLEGVDLDSRSTASVKLIEGFMGPAGTTLASLSDNNLCIAQKKLAVFYDDGGAQTELATIMDRVLAKANREVTTTTLTFQSPKLSDTSEVLTSALNPNWLSRNLLDYDADGLLNQTTDAFDAVFLSALPVVDLSAPPDPSLARTLFSVDFNAGKLNGACGEINRFKWVRDEPGRQMYFVGGIHTSSPIQDPQIDASLGNRGGWTPNQLRMYDDGTHGDKTANDNVWSIYFDLPPGIRIGYKYTWGKQGDLWTGTEEWPGNQRILQVTDLNSDGYVYRVDNFGDEGSNKDLGNLNTASGGSLDWDEDINGDGHPEAREAPVDASGNFCGPAVDRTFVTPVWVPAVTLKCEDFVAE
ncbi:MAG: CBM20 domain-containing protein [Myxococcota bacterium]|nr:CBM20 domain-containing protein [Myxococcota bacterium]